MAIDANGNWYYDGSDYSETATPDVDTSRATAYDDWNLDNYKKDLYADYNYATPVNTEIEMDKSLPFKERIKDYMTRKKQQAMREYPSLQFDGVERPSNAQKSQYYQPLVNDKTKQVFAPWDTQGYAKSLDADKQAALADTYTSGKRFATGLSSSEDDYSGTLNGSTYEPGMSYDDYVDSKSLSSNLNKSQALLGKKKKKYNVYGRS